MGLLLVSNGFLEVIAAEIGQEHGAFLEMVFALAGPHPVTANLAKMVGLVKRLYPLYYPEGSSGTSGKDLPTRHRAAQRAIAGILEGQDGLRPFTLMGK